MVTLELIALDGVKFSGQVHEVVLPTPDGFIAIFTNHAPLVSLTVNGRVGIRNKPNDPDDFMEYFAVGNGIIDVNKNVVRVLADEAAAAEEIIEAEEQKAMQAAKQLLAEATDQVSLEKAQSLIDRQQVRLQVATLKRRKSNRKHSSLQ